MNQTVKDAIFNTPVGYLASTLKQRNPGPQGLGSQFLEETSPTELAEANWEPFEHPAIAAPARGYKAPIPGYFGIIEVYEAGIWGIPLKLVPSRKGTGFMEVVATVRYSERGAFQRRVSHSVALIGPGDDGKDILWTVFPGDPIPPSVMPIVGEAREITAEEAKKLGFEYAKIEYASQS